MANGFGGKCTKKCITADAVRATMYDQYRHEIDAIWRNSRFIWGFETVIFSGYGIIMIESLKCPDSLFGYYLVAVFLSMIGLCVGTIWIALAKASKTWQEWYESRISGFEQDRDVFHFHREYAMGGTTNRVPEVDRCLMSMKSGLFSPGRINIFIAQFNWFIWLLLSVLPQAMHYCAKGDVRLVRTVSFVCISFYAVFVALLIVRTRNSYIRKEDYKGEFILETYVRVEQCIKRLTAIKGNNDLGLMYDFVIDDYCSLSWPLFNIFKAQGECQSSSQWFDEPYESLKREFCSNYIDGNLDTDLCKEYNERFNTMLNDVLALLREFYKE